MRDQLAEMKSSSKIAEQTLTATQRPWVSVVANVGPKGLYFDVNDANLDLTFSLKNTGTTPSVSVRVIGSPRIDVLTNDRIAELEKVCSKARTDAQDPKMVAYTIFPGDTLKLNYLYSFASKNDLRPILEKRYGLISPVVIGCIDYFFTFGQSTHHQSRFVYELDFPTANGGSRAIEISEGDKSADVLRLNPWLEGGSFQAD